MSIRYVLLGFLNWKPFAGYDLKKLLSNSLSFHWSGNNNQVYGTLIQLHKEGAVSIEVQQQEKLPARKVYTITERGRDELHAWLSSPAELPSARSDFSTRLAWAFSLPHNELVAIIDEYAASLEAQVLMYKERIRRSETSAGQEVAPGRDGREVLLWRGIQEHAAGFYEFELDWLRKTREAIAKSGSDNLPGR
ncbi:MAG: PadR family transcriptional regulator [Spirochaetae bacterium HGW-Spirochaetae-9]|nr:MAG: PadR family transcriptional regulator [Spirochaetae bacterium HGW-Spirochaetae-9]